MDKSVGYGDCQEPIDRLPAYNFLNTVNSHLASAMTVCIAAVCGHDYVVVATDRMLTLPFPSIEYEADYSKVIEITKNCVATTAGSAIAYTPVFLDASPAIKSGSLTDVKRIAELTRSAYEKIRNVKLHEHILATYGLDLKTFYEKNLTLQQSVVGLVMTFMQNYNYNLVLLIAGVDENGSHIFRIDNPAILNCFDSIGYHAIGSGEIHAISTFIVNDYRLRDTSLQKGLALVFEAKKRSEKAQGVGQQTDMYVVSKDSTAHLPDEFLKELNGVYEQRVGYEKKAVLEVETMISKLDIGKYITPSGGKPKG